MAALSAGARVAGTTELLESILLNLNHDEIDLKTLLISQRASTAFRNTIQGSFKLRQALYLEPPTALRGDTELQYGMNPLLRLNLSEVDTYSYASLYSKWKLSLPLNSQRQFSISILGAPGEALFSMDDTRPIPMTDLSDSSPSTLATIPSWKKMYVFQWRVTVECRSKRGRVRHLYTNPKFGDIAHRASDKSAPYHYLQLMDWTFTTK